MPKGRARIYMEKARRFADSARSALDDGLWDPAASAAIHAAINAADAACVWYAGARGADVGHRQVIDLLETLEGPPSREVARLAGHLDRLLARKTLAEYLDKLVTEREARETVTAMDRALSIVGSWSASWK